MNKEAIQKRLELASTIRDKHYTPFRWFFFFMLMFLFGCIWALIITGAKFVGLDVFDGDEFNLSWLRRDVMIGVIFFTLVLLFIFGAGAYLSARKHKNLPICCYMIIVFFVGFIPMLGQGGAIMSLTLIDTTEFHEECNAS